MIQLESGLYTARAYTTGEREGASRSTDGRHDARSQSSAYDSENQSCQFAALLL
jgi:hypothetical protein